MRNLSIGLFVMLISLACFSAWNHWRHNTRIAELKSLVEQREESAEAFHSSSVRYMNEWTSVSDELMKANAEIAILQSEIKRMNKIDAEESQ